MENSFIPLTEILCIIPMKGINDAKKRLRISFSDDKQELISNIVFKLFINTINAVKPLLDFAVVSPSEDILEIGLEHGASFIYQDLGIDLNDALTSSISYAYTASKWKYILILTADLPYLSKESFFSIQKYFTLNSFTIISAPERFSMQGTSGLLIPLDSWHKINLEFGQDSFNKFKKQLSVKNLNYTIAQDKVGFDLDTIEDFAKFKKESPVIFDHFINKREIDQLLN